VNATAFDLNAHIAQLFVYPVKSCAGVSVTEAVLLDTGLDLDRAWMVVDSEGEFVSQRELPRMALIQPALKFNEVILRAPGMLALHLAVGEVQEPTRVRVWSDEVKAYDMGDIAAQWFSDFLGQKLRLVRFDPEQERLSSKKWTGEINAPNQFSDGYPLLVLSQSALAPLNERLAKLSHPAVGIERFRPNIVLTGLEAHDEDRVGALHIQSEDGPLELRLVKPCPRCPIPNIDPSTAQSNPAVGDALAQYRADKRVDGAISFGMNAVLATQGEFTLRVGQSVGGNFRFG
jgi:uncharacterized protein